MAQRRRVSARWALVVSSVVAVAIHLWGLYRPVGPPVPRWFPAADKVEHLIGFAAPLLLILLTRRSFPPSRGVRGVSPRKSAQHQGVRRVSPRKSAQPRGRSVPRSFVVAMTCVFVVNGVVSELFQYAFLPSRSGDPLDVAADWTGCALGVACYLLLDRRLTARAARSSP